jgi:Tfp pilus assembly protein PilF
MPAAIVTVPPFHHRQQRLLRNRREFISVLFFFGLKIKQQLGNDISITKYSRSLQTDHPASQSWQKQ